MSSTFDDALGAFEESGFAPDTEELPNQPTPEADAPEVDESQPAEPDSIQVTLDDLPEEAQILLRARQREMQADYTRKTQELAQQRQEAEQYQQFVTALNSDPEFAQAVLERLQAQLQAAGYLDQAPAEDEWFEPDEYGGPEEDPYLRELQELKEWRAQVEAERQDAYNEAIINRQIAEIRSQHQDYTDADIEDIYALGFYTNGDLHAANEMFRGMIDRNLARYLESKKGVQTPAALPGGQGVAAPTDLVHADDKVLRAAATEALIQTLNQ